VLGHLTYEFFPAFWAALDATDYAGGRTTIDGEKGEQPGKVPSGPDRSAIHEPPPVATSEQIGATDSRTFVKGRDPQLSAISIA